MMVNPALGEEQKPPPIDKINQRAAGIIGKKTGSPESVWTGPTIRALGASNVISHAAATFCIQVPIFEANAATNTPKKTV